ncbi:MAG: hypothetical protein NT176_08550, partial [Proteobacteria bacterium]|nr:hypothetical protein [Pseudomonadota bacterium]
MNAPASTTLTNRRFEVRYRIRGATQAFAEEAAAAIALEQSVEVPLDAIFDAAVRERIVGQVLGVEQTGEGIYEARVALAVDTTGDDVAQTLNMLFGNSSMHAHVELLDADLPESLVKSCSGPRFGIEGLRRLTGAYGRPLTCTALKPQGLPVSELARICHVFAAAGVEMLSFDEALRTPSRTSIVHRPEQMNTIHDQNLLLTLGETVVVTQQDLIAYRHGSYHENEEFWQRYRDSARDSLRAADRALFFSATTLDEATAAGLTDPEFASVVGIGVEAPAGLRDARQGSVRPDEVEP